MTFHLIKMTKDAVSGVLGNANRVIRRKPRKSLQTLQLTADEQEVVRPNMVKPKDKTTSKKNQSSAVEKVISEKENLHSLRRSKRKVAVSDALTYAESPDDPKTGNVPVKPKTKKTAVKPKKERATSVKKTASNQTKLNFPPASSEENKTENIETAPPEKIVTDASTSEVTEDSGFDATNEICEESSTPFSNGSKLQLGECTTSTPDNDISLITSATPTLYYWKELAEQRRIALEKALRENELIYDQLIVLEAENSQLKQLVREAENLASIVKNIIE